MMEYYDYNFRASGRAGWAHIPPRPRHRHFLPQLELDPQQHQNILVV